MLIILAHVCPQESFIFNLRNFDVPMMVIVSGYLFSQRYAGNKNYSFLSYLRKRFLRLITPVWCFFIFFFIAVGAIEKLQGNKYPFSIREIINAFLLLDGAGWIIRVFFIVAILSIFILKLRRLAVKDTYFLILLSCIYFGYEIVLKFCNDLPLPVFNLAIIDFFVRKIWFLGYHIFTKKILFYAIPYGCIFGLGILLPSIKKKFIFFLSIFFGVCFSLLALYYSKNSGFCVLN
ncbi:MAG: acyltransferase, partial [Okeania sp. SIO2H7]|nr:acyltransferase [Okeania sp. SIO2H7]